MAFQSDAFQNDAFQTDGGSSTVTSSFAASAVLFRGQAGSFAANAIALRSGASALTADSIRKAALSSQFTASAFVQPWFTASAWIIGGAYVEGAITADAVALSVRSGSVPAGSVLLGERTSSFAADWISRQHQSGSLVADAFVQPWFSASAWIVGGSVARTFTLSAIIRLLAGGSLTADGIRRVTVATDLTLVFPGYQSETYTGIGGNSNILAGPLDIGRNQQFQVVLNALSDGNLGFFGGPTANLANATENTGWQDGTVGIHTFTTGANSQYVWIYSYGWNAGKTGSGYVKNYGGPKANALIVQYGRPGSKTADAWIGYSYARMTHRRDDPVHYDIDYASIIQLSSLLGVYVEGADLCSVLKDLNARIVDLEGRNAQWL